MTSTERTAAPAAPSVAPAPTLSRRRYAVSDMPSSASSPDIFTPLADSAASASIAEHRGLVAAHREASAAASAHPATRDQVDAADADALAKAMRDNPSAKLPGTPNLTAWLATADDHARRVAGLAGAVVASYVEMVETIGHHSAEMLATFTAEAAEARARLDHHLSEAAALVRVIDRSAAALELTADIAASSPTDRIRPRGAGAWGLVRSGPNVLVACR